MTALLYLIQIYRVVDRFKGLRVQGCGSGFAANSNGALRAGPLSLSRRRWGTAPAVDRVLSLMAYLRRSPSLFFTPPSPSNLRPFGAPPSIGRREYPRKPLPLEGAAERSEAGLASFFGRRSGATVKRTLVQHAPLGKATDTREMLLKPAPLLFFDAACLNPESINL